jgi:broad specificity phosphatase PhoE
MAREALWHGSCPCRGTLTDDPTSVSGYPASLTLIRHAQSAGNVANDAAIADGLPELDLALRDMDVPLSELGETQAADLRSWVERSPRPEVILCSPYLRAVDTAALAFGSTTPLILDERLREREFGILDRLTKHGIEQRHPDQAAARAFLGKFFHRPPGGESWADVAGRVRSVWRDIRLDHPGHVVVVTHQAVITLFRYVLEARTEEELLEIDRTSQIANTAVTVYEHGEGAMRLALFNDTTHLPAAETTTASDRPAVPR